jgi:hypothetical protein
VNLPGKPKPKIRNLPEGGCLFAAGNRFSVYGGKDEMPQAGI